MSGETKKELTDTVNPRPSGAGTLALCLRCGIATGQVVDCQIGGQEAWFVPCCSACHEAAKKEGE